MSTLKNASGRFLSNAKEYFSNVPVRMKSYLACGALKGDVIGGLVTGSVLVPQSMSYAILASLPPEVGLYSTISLVVYAALGSSPQLSVAPVAMSSLLVTMATAQYKGTQMAVDTALVVAFLAGVIQIFLAITFIGEILTRWLSRTMLSGYTTGVALSIQISQLSGAFGFKIATSQYPVYNLYLFFSNIGSTKPVALGFFLVGTAVLLMVQKIVKPTLRKNVRFIADFATMVVVIVGAASAYGLLSRWPDLGLPILGYLPAGFKTPGLPPFEIVDGTIIGTSVAVGLMGFFEGYAVARTLPSAASVSGGRELLAVGASNIVSSAFNGYSVAGGLARTMVSVNSGSTTQVSSLFAFLTCIIAIMALSGPMRYIPSALLSSVVIVAVLGMIKSDALREAFRVSKVEFSVAIATTVMVLGVGPMYGLAFGVIASIVDSLYHMAIPHVAELGEMRNHLLRNLKRYPNEAKRIPGVVIVRLDAPLFFANAGLFFNKCRRMIQDREGTPVKLPTERELQVGTREYIRAVIIDASGVGWIDLSAVHEMHKFQTFLLSRKTSFILTEVRGPVRDLLDRFNKTAKKAVAPFHEALPRTSPVLAPSEAQALLSEVDDELPEEPAGRIEEHAQEPVFYSVHSLEEALEETKATLGIGSPQLNPFRTPPSRMVHGLTIAPSMERLNLA